MPVLYLKYRPQTLDDLIGQPQVKDTLINAFKNNKLAHAYLFVGPRGTGKTSTARILAKMVNCEFLDDSGKLQTTDKVDTTESSSISAASKIPCNQCSSCVSITDGSSLDLIEIDAASNRGIDDIRSLRENVKLSPASAKKKIYIIDEVHMLTTEAFNALLKTLEEPPSHVMFILATTEVNKVPQTILSRVQRLNFSLAKMEDLVMALTKIAAAEKISVDEEALQLIAKKADGSFRDAVKLLDQISAGSDKVTAKLVSETLKGGDFEAVLNLLKSLANHDVKSALEQVISLEDEGVNIRDLVLSVMDVLRNLIFIKSNLENLAKGNFDANKYSAVAELANQFSMADLVLGLEKFQEALEQMKAASIQSLPLELAVVEICEANKKETAINLGMPSEKPEKVERPAEEKPAAAEKVDDQKNITVSREALILEKSVESTGDESDLSKIKEKWTFVLETIRSDNFSLEALLRNVKVTSIIESQVLIEVPYAFHQRILESPKSKALIEHVFSDVLEKPVRISTVLGVRPQKIEDIANIEVAQDDEIISLASEIFNGKLID